MHYDRVSGRYALRRFEHCSFNSSSALTRRCGLSTALATGMLPAGAQHTYLGFGYVLAYLPHSAGSYELLRVHRQQPVKAPASSNASTVNTSAADKTTTAAETTGA